MESQTEDLIREANAKLRMQLSRLRDALEGRQHFRVDDVKAISEPVGWMAPVVSQATTGGAPKSNGELKAYAATLAELQTVLEQTRFMLLARRTHLCAARSHAERMNLWAAALKQTQ